MCRLQALVEAEPRLAGDRSQRCPSVALGAAGAWRGLTWLSAASTCAATINMLMVCDRSESHAGLQEQIRDLGGVEAEMGSGRGVSRVEGDGSQVAGTSRVKGTTAQEGSTCL